MDKKSPKRVRKKENDNKSIKFRCDYYSTPLKVLQSRGWTQVRESRDMRWDIWWCDTSDLRMALDSSTKLRPQQRVSHFLNHCELTRKNYLYRNLKRYKRLLLKAGKTREAELCDAMPTSFELPNEYRMLVEEYRRRPGSTWIVKPATGSQGRGIFLFQRLKDLVNWRGKECITTTFTPDMEIVSCPETYVVQKYIDDPYLLGGRKFDLRIYVLVTSFEPLKVWLAREGFARLSGEQFSLERIDDSRIHLTNMSIQLKSKNRGGLPPPRYHEGEDDTDLDDEFEEIEYEEEEEGNKLGNAKLGRKWPLRSLRQYLTTRHGNVAVNELLQNISGVSKTAFAFKENHLIKALNLFSMDNYERMSSLSML